MLEPVYDAADREEWDEHDWERFLRRADARTAKYQELFETLACNPRRDLLIAREMGWEEELKACGGDQKKCPVCNRRFECEVYEMLRLMAEPETIEEDPDAEDLIACFEQLREIPAYTVAQDFATRVEEVLAAHRRRWAADDELRAVVFGAQMVPAQIAGGHGIGYERDSLCGNIANCKRALGSLELCVEQLPRLEARGLLPADGARALREHAAKVSHEVNRWIENLRARIWWR